MNEQSLAVMIKPVGSLCNMRCSYCYYLDTPYADGLPAYTMTDEILEQTIRACLAAAKGPILSFTWHGGEPAGCGINFYEKVLELQQKYCPDGLSIINNLQTNGTLLDDAFCDFLAAHHFDVGLSIDGTKSVHDAYRHLADGRPTYEQVYQAAKRLIAHGIQPDLLCTVHDRTLSQGKEVYRALRGLGTGWLQFIPIVRRDAEGRVTKDSADPVGYGSFLKEVFIEWFFHDLGKTQVQLFAEMASVLAGGSASVCTMAPVCGQVPVIEHDGSVYACDHFVRESHRLGHIAEAPLEEMLSSALCTSFGESKTAALTRECRSCPYLEICRGGCLKDRFANSADGEPGQYYLCPGLKDLFAFAVPILKEAIRLSSLHTPQDQIQQRIRAHLWAPYRAISRNDPCPCGSGRKFKACHMRWLP
ncbi:MAG: anaerobic sulfatase maturase [Clostridiales bacterium]|nr:anaerobic sulfatase maturase [Clostridiales bacterium]